MTMASEQAIVLFVVFLFWFRRFLAEEGDLFEAVRDAGEVGVRRMQAPEHHGVARWCRTSSIPTFWEWKRWYAC